MANFLNKILLYKEATVDTIPASPTCYALKAESFGIQATQASETNNELGNGRGASAKGFGTLSIGGDMGMIWNTDNAPILMTHGIGKQTATADATADVWALTTVYAKGDLINHTDGLHTLTCYVGGTSGATEPDLASYTTAGAGRGVRIDDGTATWIIMPKLFLQSGERGDCLESFGVEVSDNDLCVGGATAYTRFGGNHIGSLPFSISGGDMSVKTSVSTSGMSEEDSILVVGAGGTYEEMSAKAGFSEVEVVSDFFFLEDCTFFLNGVQASVKATSFDATINNNISIEDALNADKIVNIGLVNIEGTISLLMDTQMFIDASNHLAQSAKFTFQKANGCLMELEFPQFTMDKTMKEYSTDKTTMVSIPLSAFDTTDIKSVLWRTISPISY